MKGFRYLRNVATLRMDREKCKGCGWCVEVCPHQVFSMEEGLARIVDLDACMECGACMRNCPFDAIRVDAGVGCASGMIHRWLSEHGIGRSDRGCCS